MAKVGASLQHAISRDPKDIIFGEYRVLAGAYIDAVVSCVMWWNNFKTVILTVNKFSFINMINFDHH